MGAQQTSLPRRLTSLLVPVSYFVLLFLVSHGHVASCNSPRADIADSGFPCKLRLDSSPAKEPAVSTLRIHESPLFNFDSGAGVTLSATKFNVAAAGRIFSPLSDIDVGGAPGRQPSNSSAGFTTLELTWFAHRIEMRVFIYFAANRTHWWASVIRTYDGTSTGEWVTRRGRYFETPLGAAFSGDFRTHALTIEGMILRAFTSRAQTCARSGAPGSVLLQRSDMKDSFGSTAKSAISGASSRYAFTVTVLEAATCAPVKASDVVFRVSTGDSRVAVVDEVLYSPSWALTELWVSITFTGVGKTAVNIYVVRAASENVVGSLAVSISVAVNDNVKQSDGKTSVMSISAKGRPLTRATNESVFNDAVRKPSPLDVAQRDL